MFNSKRHHQKEEEGNSDPGSFRKFQMGFETEFGEQYASLKLSARKKDTRVDRKLQSLKL
jgi:hypothetical protein